jgi:hypothetical protein
VHSLRNCRRSPLLIRAGGGRRWWAHLAFTRTNIELTISQNQIEELMNIKGIGEKSFLKLKPMITVGTEKADKE